jgi:hypothetical protein
MPTLARASTHASLFIGFVLVWLPARLLPPAGVARPARFGAPQVAGLAVVAGGATIAAWRCCRRVRRWRPSL